MKETQPISLKNQFLIAMPQMVGSSFANTLTYLCEHNEEGAMGLIINRPTDIALIEILQQLNIEPNATADQLAPIFAGGPVHPDRGFILHSGPTSWESSTQISDSISLTTSQDILSSIAHDEGPDNCLVALGYAGWGAGQLEQELADNCWLTAPANSDIIFRMPHEERIDAATSLLGFSLAQLGPAAGHA